MNRNSKMALQLLRYLGILVLINSAYGISIDKVIQRPTKFIEVVPQRECETIENGIDMCDYESHEEMLEKLESLATKYPNLAMVDSVGNSVQGRPLAYIKISGNVSDPSFLILGLIMTLFSSN